LRRTPAPISERGSGSGLFRIQQAGASAFRSTPSLQFNSRQSRDSASPRFFTKLGCAVNSLRLANDIQQQQIIPQDTSRFVFHRRTASRRCYFFTRRPPSQQLSIAVFERSTKYSSSSL
jgi:hypothetical protein